MQKPHQVLRSHARTRFFFGRLLDWARIYHGPQDDIRDNTPVRWDFCTMLKKNAFFSFLPKCGLETKSSVSICFIRVRTRDVYLVYMNMLVCIRSIPDTCYI